MPGRVLLLLWVLLQAGICRASEGCLRGVIEGEVRSGESFVHPLGNGLEFMLEPVASGWIVRVVPGGVARPAHDYAELATPPYQSVNPLLITTDFSFRAQDVVGWNPRRFHFAGDDASFRAMLQLYRQVEHPGAGAERDILRLAGMSDRAPEGALQILDAHLVPGTANQARTAAMVASHFGTTAHLLEQKNGTGGALGRVTWIRFRVELELPKGFRPAPGLKAEPHPCRRSAEQETGAN